MATCADCRFGDFNGVAVGKCRVRAPAIGRLSDERRPAWPIVVQADWCGEHQPTKPDRAASLALMAEAMEPFIVAANAMGAQTAETLVSLDLRDGEGEPITLHSDDFLRLADAYARATGA